MDDARFERMVLEVQDKALRLAHGFLGDWDDARDAVQEALVKAYRRRHTFRGEADPATWFYPILTNHCRDRLRRRRVRSFLLPWRGRGDDGSSDAPPELQAPSPDPSPEREAQRGAFRRALLRALKTLPARQQEVFRLRALTGLSVAETASALGISAGAVKAHLFRATQALQKQLAEWNEGFR